MRLGTRILSPIRRAPAVQRRLRSPNRLRPQFDECHGLPHADKLDSSRSGTDLCK
ncbi:MAG: hypothetical protein JAZ02_03100 [Candidatus Thiodiazotropha endolucinida]|nr:hypothetical protein [Candidatus Thiodiazotropha endolucinida]